MKHFDLELILVVLTSVAAAIWLFDLIVLMPKRKRKLANLPENASQQEIDRAMTMPNWVDFGKSFFPVLLIVLLLRSFLVEPFRIPSNSMMPTLLTGDFILVNKYTYGIRLPVSHQKILPLNEPQRGDVVVFRYPGDGKTPFIKRVVGLPGDRIHYRFDQQTLYINGAPVPKEFMGVYEAKGAGMKMHGLDVVRQQFPEKSFSTLINRNQPAQLGRYGQFTVPEGQYFVLGDNRDHSHDSRYWGSVPEENLIGKAFFIWMSLDWKIRGSWISWSRIGTIID